MGKERQRVAAHQLRVESVPPEPDADALGKPRGYPGESHKFREIAAQKGRWVVVRWQNKTRS